MVTVTLPNGDKAEYEALEEHDGVRRARIPEEIFDMDASRYSEFLERRRKLMAAKIRDYFKSL